MRLYVQLISIFRFIFYIFTGIFSLFAKVIQHPSLIVTDFCMYKRKQFFGENQPHYRYLFIPLFWLYGKTYRLKNIAFLQRSVFIQVFAGVKCFTKINVWINLRNQIFCLCTIFVEKFTLNDNHAFEPVGFSFIIVFGILI